MTTSPSSHLGRYLNDANVTASAASLVVCLVPLAVLLYRLSSRHGVRGPTVVDHVWKILVYLMPSSVVLALDPQSSADAASTDAQGASDDPRLRHHAAKDEALRRILGLRWTGLVPTLHGNGVVSRIRRFSTVTKDGRPAGLGNSDNSCYQNSVIQGLASLPSMSIYLDQVLALTTAGASGTSPAALTALRDIIRDLNSPATSGQRFWNPAALRSMSSWQQQDAQEYFSKVVDELEREASRTLKLADVPPGLEDAVERVQDPGHSTEPEHGACGGELDLSERSSSVSTPASPISLPGHLGSTRRPTPRLSSPLEGLLAQRVGCMRCGWSEGLSLIPFICLTVPLGREWSYHVGRCLDEYTRVDRIEGVECARCTLLLNKSRLERILEAEAETARGQEPSASQATETLRASATARLESVNTALEEDDFSESTLTQRCRIAPKNRVTVTKSRQAVIARAPKSLVIHVNRSIFDAYSGAQKKNYAEVRFEQVLDLSPWYLGSRKRDESESDGPVFEQWGFDPAESMLPRDGQQSGGMGPRYEVRAVISHYGRHENGHYVCYRQIDELSDLSAEARQVPVEGLTEPTKRRWWRISDDDVIMVDSGQVLDQGGVFMLFYERIDPESPSKDIDEKASSLGEPIVVNTAVQDTSLPMHDEGPLSKSSTRGSLALGLEEEEAKGRDVAERISRKPSESRPSPNGPTSSSLSLSSSFSSTTSDVDKIGLDEAEQEPESSATPSPKPDPDRFDSHLGPKHGGESPHSRSAAPDPQLLTWNTGHVGGGRDGRDGPQENLLSSSVVMAN